MGRSLLLGVMCALVALGCDEGGDTDAGMDAGPTDAAPPGDAGRDAEVGDAGPADAGPMDAGLLDAGPEPGTFTLVGVGAWGLRTRSTDGASWSACGNPSTGNDHSPDLLRDVAYGDGVFLAVGGDRNAMVMRSVDGEHWEVDLHPTDGCDDEPYPASCGNWMGGAAYGEGVWLAGGGNGALMRSTDGGQTWTGLHPDPRPSAVRAMVYGGGRFVASTDSGAVIVSSDAGDTWTAHDVWDHSTRLAYGAGTFIAQGRRWNGSGFDYGCGISTDAADTFEACPSELTQAGQAVHDGARWVAPTEDGYLESPDGRTWTSRAVEGVPGTLLFAEGTWYGRSGARVWRSEDLETWTELTAEMPTPRAWVGGRVLDGNLPVADVPACVDNR